MTNEAPTLIAFPLLNMLLKPMVFVAVLSGWGSASHIHSRNTPDNNATLFASDVTHQQPTYNLLDTLASPELNTCKRSKGGKRPGKGKKGKGKEWDSSPGNAAPVSKASGRKSKLPTLTWLVEWVLRCGRTDCIGVLYRSQHQHRTLGPHDQIPGGQGQCPDSKCP